MKILLQRVDEVIIKTGGKKYASSGKGLLLFVGEKMTTEVK